MLDYAKVSVSDQGGDKCCLSSGERAGKSGGKGRWWAGTGPALVVARMEVMVMC